MTSRKPVLYIATAIIVIAVACLLYVLHARSGTLVSTSALIPPSTTAPAALSDHSVLHANGITFEIAATDAVQQRGLGGRAMIPDHYGMLFVFPQDSTEGFWMKDMLQPIDIIWLSDKGTIITLDANVATSTYPSVLYPASPARYVLETRAGFSASKNWSVGDTIPLPLPYGKIVSN